ncbi:MAG: hypothetical protein ACOH2V_14565 [Candidatus Saccharimonadaceae bacterium]
MNQARNTMNPISELNEKIEKYKNECGCTLGAKFMSVAFVSSLFITIWRYHFISMNFLWHVPLILLITICSAGIGKLSGILYAKLKYKQLSKQLSNHLANLKMEETDYAGNMD